MSVLELALFVAIVSLLPASNVHARLLSRKWRKSSGNNDTQIVLQIHSLEASDSVSGSRINNDAITVTSDSNPNNFFHTDYLYIFHPTSNDEQKWQIQRIPKSDQNRRSLQSAEEDASTNMITNGEGDGIVNFGTEDSKEKSGKNEKEYMTKITNVLLSLSCVVLAALAAGLTMGMLSLDPLSLEIKRRASTIQKERQWSEELLPLLVGHSKRHRLLVSLLLLNSIANEGLPLFLDELFPSKLASIIVSVTLVLMFGEIIPSALFTGPDQVELAAKLVPLVKAVMFVLAPIAVPIARLLDKVLHDHDDSGGGHKNSDVDQDVTEGNYYNRSELTALVRIQYESQLADKRRRKHKIKMALPVNSLLSISVRNPGSGHSHHSIRSISREFTVANQPVEEQSMTQTRMPSIHKDEITMIEGALAMTTKVAADVYTPIRRMYALRSDTILDEDQMVDIWAHGFSRVPVYEPKYPPSVDLPPNFVDTSRIVGVLMVRQLIVVNPEEGRPITTLPLALPSCISPSMHLVDLINHFQAGGGRGKGGLHLALVCARPTLATEALERGESIPKDAGVVGIITLEDVVEELLQEEIYDESDRDLELARWGVKKWRRFVKRKKLTRLQQQKKKDDEKTEATPLLK
mmetsp:Transcript_56710/g.120408  ORF Transcript_56710/g.120408 Transcript_56710/m.120408 type:complete len:634 (-) Transcript_56710:147-2048(-)